MRRVSVLFALVFAALFTACPSPPKNGECKSSKDCEAQAGFGKICVSGQCAECAADAECGSGKGCQSGKCVSTLDPACADDSAFTVRFGFDQANIAGDSAAVLKKLAACLGKAPARRVLVDGHCDDRGTTQYNLALGKKRAEAVKKYLVDLGVAGAVESNTYGKEQPLCREASEGCWSRNRRAESKVER